MAPSDNRPGSGRARRTKGAERGPKAGSKAGRGARGPEGGPPRKYAGKRARRDRDEAIPGRREWGGLARKGALRATEDGRRERSDGALDRARDDPDGDAAQAEREARRARRAQRSEELRDEARIAVERANTGAARTSAPKPRSPRPLDRAPLPAAPARQEDETEALHRLLGADEAKKQLQQLRSAARAFEAERFDEAAKILRRLAELVPTVAEVRELYGLTLYRLGRYRAAAKQLEEFRVLAASTEQNPVLADCYRALGRWADVEALWRELAEVSPGAHLVEEGRIVMAGALADQGEVRAAVKLLEKGWKRPPRPRDHHLRRAYALADLYERSGDLPRARALFDWVVSTDPDFVDAERRLANLR